MMRVRQGAVVALGLGALLGFFPATGLAAGFVMEAVVDQSRLGFTAHQLLGETSGEFRRWRARVVVDPQQPERSSVEVIIDAASIDTGNARRDEHLRADDFFDVARFPEVRFVSTGVELASREQIVLVGRLTIRDTVSELRLPLALTWQEQDGRYTVRARGTITIDRFAAGLSWQSPWYLPDVKPEVDIVIDVVTAQ